MGRRKDHSAKELKAAMCQAAEKLIYTKGLHKLTARALAKEIGYTPGTIYNFYRDMDALVADVNHATLNRLHDYCLQRVKLAKPGYESLKSLAYAYIDFAHMHERAWRALFIETNRSAKPTRLPAPYQKCIANLFELLEETLQKNLNISAGEAVHAARLLWACLHGITSLMLDGRLSLVGITKPYETVDDLLSKYLKEYARA